MRGGIGYVTMMVLNPVIILFYQNCSVIPTEHSVAHAKPVASASVRAPAAAAPVKISKGQDLCTNGTKKGAANADCGHPR